MHSARTTPRFSVFLAVALASVLTIAATAVGAPPTVSITGGPDGLTTDSTPTFTFAAEEADAVECSIDQGDSNYGPCSGTDSHTASLADGTYLFRVRAIGHPRDEVATQEFTVDASVPAVTITSGPDSPTADSSPVFGFTVTGASAVECSIDQGLASYGPCSSGISHAPSQPLADGAYTFRVRASDETGNTASAAYSFAVAVLSAPQPPPGDPIAPPRTAAPRLMSPFPLVRLAGRVTSSGVKVNVLAVRARRGSLARVRVRPRCAPGSPCLARRGARTVGRAGVLRFRDFEVSYRVGTVIEIRVSRGTAIGKYTRFVIRRDKPPRRFDACLMPGTTRGSRCPTA
jgi:hypothetical protein